MLAFRVAVLPSIKNARGSATKHTRIRDDNVTTVDCGIEGPVCNTFIGDIHPHTTASSNVLPSCPMWISLQTQLKKTYGPGKRTAEQGGCITGPESARVSLYPRVHRGAATFVDMPVGNDPERNTGSFGSRSKHGRHIAQAVADHGPAAARSGMRPRCPKTTSLSRVRPRIDTGFTARTPRGVRRYNAAPPTAVQSPARRPESSAGSYVLHPQSLSSCVDAFKKNKDALQESLRLAEKATETRRRVEDALSRCLANAQILEGKWRSHIETEKLRLRALQQQQDEERERQVAVSRYVMQLKEELHRVEDSIHKAQDLFRMSTEKQAETNRLLPFLKTSSCTAVNGLLELEERLTEELSAQLVVETLMHFAAKDIRWICRLRNPEGPTNQDVCVALTPPDAALEAVKNDFTMQKSKDTTCNEANSIESTVTPKEPAYRVSVAYDNPSTLCRSGSSSARDFTPRSKLMRSSGDLQSSVVSLPVSGKPSSWLSVVPVPSANTHLEAVSSPLSRTPVGQQNATTRYPLAIPFDRIIEYDPAQRPHTLLVTDWENIALPDPSDHEKQVADPEAPYSSDSRQFPRSVAPDAFEHHQVVNLVTVLVNELLDSVVDNGPAKPKVVGILSFGTPNSSHPQTFWGDKQPHSVTQPPLVLGGESIGSRFPEKTNVALVGCLEAVLSAVFQAQHPCAETGFTPPPTASRRPCVEGCIVLAPCERSISERACTSEQVSDSFSTNQVEPSTVSDYPSALPDAAVELLRSIQSQQGVPGMSLQRSNRSAISPDNVPSPTLSPTNFLKTLLTQEPFSRVPPLSFSSLNKENAFTSPSFSVKEPPLSARLCVENPGTTVGPPSTPLTARTIRSKTADLDTRHMESVLLPPFKCYTGAQQLLDDVYAALNAASVETTPAHLGIVLRITSPAFGINRGSSYPDVLTIVLSGLTIPCAQAACVEPEDLPLLLPPVGDANVDEVFVQLLQYPKSRTSSGTGCFKKAKRVLPSFFETPTFDKSASTPTTPMGKLFYYLNIMTAYEEKFQEVKPKAATMASKSQKEDGTSTKPAYKGGCLTVITHINYPQMEDPVQYTMLKALNTIIKQRDEEQS